MIALVAALFAAPVAARPTGNVVGEVTIKSIGLFGVGNKSDRSGVVVYLEGVPGSPPARRGPPPEIHQREKTFVPRVLAVRTGEAVTFPNDDRIFHNVFSVSQPARFDLGLYKRGESRKVVFEAPGTVDVYCNIHPEMAASIKVLDTGWFQVTGPDGRFRFEGVPPGTYPLVAWQPRGDGYRGTVTIAAGGTARVEIALTASGGVARHLRKDGTPYGRYQ